MGHEAPDRASRPLPQPHMHYLKADALHPFLAGESGFYDVTPALATQLLNLNRDNRPLKKGYLEKYVKQMNKGAFYRAQGQIKITSEPKLIQGQHTLLAVIKSNTTQTLGIELNADPRIAPFLDSGASRSAADNLKMLGKDYPDVISAGSKIFINYKRFPSVVWSSGGKFKIWNDEVDRFVERYYDNYLRHLASLVHEKYLEFSSLNQGAALALFLVCLENGIPTDYPDEFFHQISLGSQKDGKPIPTGFSTLAARTYISGETPRKLSSAHRQQWHLHVYIKAFNSFLNFENVKRLKMNELAPLPELYPHLCNKTECVIFNVNL